jgi:hypothetical protein
MDYSRNRNITVGNEGFRRYQVSGKKVIVKCLHCEGFIIQWIEDTIYRCHIHNTTMPISFRFNTDFESLAIKNY